MVEQVVDVGSGAANERPHAAPEPRKEVLARLGFRRRAVACGTGAKFQAIARGAGDSGCSLGLYRRTASRPGLSRSPDLADHYRDHSYPLLGFQEVIAMAAARPFVSGVNLG